MHPQLAPLVKQLALSGDAHEHQSLHAGHESAPYVVFQQWFWRRQLLSTIAAASLLLPTIANTGTSVHAFGLTSCKTVMQAALVAGTGQQACIAEGRLKKSVRAAHLAQAGSAIQERLAWHWQQKRRR